MRSDEIGVSRQGNLAVIKHTNFEIKFNLSKGTWDYSDESGDTIIRDGCTRITLENGTVVKTEDAGTRGFVTELPKRDVFGTYHQVRFSHEATGRGIRIHTYLKCYAEHPSIHINVGVENLKSEPLRLENITVLGVSANRGAVLLGGAPADYHLFINMPPISPGVSKQLYEGFILSETDAMHPSHDGVLRNTKAGKALVFGFLTTEKWWPRIQVGCQKNSGRGSQAQGRRAATSGVNLWSLDHDCRLQCNAGEEIASETVYLNFTGDGTAAYEHYMSLLAAQHTAGLDGSPKQHRPAAVWTFSDFDTDTEEPFPVDALRQQTDALAENRFFHPDSPGAIDTIQLDTAGAFMTGATASAAQDLDALQVLAEHIREKGFKAGIRFNPFFASLDSELVKKHPDYFIREQSKPTNTDRRATRNGRGRPSYKPATVHLPENGNEVALLDVSHPAVQSRLREQIKKMVGECGYTFLNVDFTVYTLGLTNVSRNLYWRDKNLTAVQLYRLAGTLIREAIAEAKSESRIAPDEVLLAGYNAVSGACIGTLDISAPLLSPSVGGVVANRVSDAWHHQRGTKHRLSRYAAHIREHNVLWGHVFGEIAVDEPRPMNGAIVEMTAAALSGGTVFCADDFSVLTPSRAAALAKIFPLIGKAATPIDLYEEPFPKLWSLPISTARETWYLAAVFNWNDYTDEVYFELETLGIPKSKEFLVHDFWMSAYLGKVSGGLTLLNIPPRSAKLLCFREEQEVPQLLATDMHYTQGCVEILSAGWDESSQSYLVVCKPLRQAEGSCFIHVPETYLPISVSTYGSGYHYEWDKPIYRLTFTKPEPGQLVHASVQFAQTSGGTG